MNDTATDLTQTPSRFETLLEDLNGGSVCAIGHWKITNAKAIEGTYKHFFVATVENPEINDGKAFESALEVSLTPEMNSAGYLVDLSVEIAMKMSITTHKLPFTVNSELATPVLGINLAVAR
jgi:hypothetical protein